MVLSFDLYFRKNPFAGEFTIFGGLEECIRFIANFKITEEEIKFLRTVMPTCEVGLLVLSKTCILLWEILHYVIFVPSINMLNCAHLVIHDSLRVVWQSTNLCFPLLAIGRMASLSTSVRLTAQMWRFMPSLRVMLCSLKFH